MYYPKQNKRSANFSQHERDALIDCVQRYKHIIEDKRTDSKAICKKQTAWMRIVVVYNSQLGVTKRTAKQLQSAWKNMKRMTKVFKEPENMDGDRRIEDKRRENARVLSVLEASSNDPFNDSDNSQVGDEQDGFYIETDDLDIKSEPIDDDYEFLNPPDITSTPSENYTNTSLSESTNVFSNGTTNSLVPVAKLQVVQKETLPISNAKANPKVQSSVSSRLLAPKPPQPPPTYQVILQPKQNNGNLIQHIQPLLKHSAPLSSKQKLSKSSKTSLAIKNVKSLANNQSSYIALQPATAINQDPSIGNQNNQLSSVLSSVPLLVNQQLPNGNAPLSINSSTPSNQLPQVVQSEYSVKSPISLMNTESLKSLTTCRVAEQQNNSYTPLNNYSHQEHIERMKLLKLERVLMKKEHKEKMAMYKAKREYYEGKKRKIEPDPDS